MSDLPGAGNAARRGLREWRGVARAFSLVRISDGRSTRYALRRAIEGVGTQWPLYHVTPSGEIVHAGDLYPLAGTSWYVQQEYRGKHSGPPSLSMAFIRDFPGFSRTRVPAAFFGVIDTPWPHAADRLRAVHWIADADADCLTLLWWFGTLVGHTDMRYGNVSFFLESSFPFVLAPTYW